MKTLVISSIAAMFMTTSVMAADASFVGYSEYAVEAETFEAGVGVEVEAGRVMFTPTAIFQYADETDFEFVGVDVDAEIGLTQNVNAYATLEFDQDFEYSELTVGVAFKF